MASSSSKTPGVPREVPKPNSDNKTQQHPGSDHNPLRLLAVTTMNSTMPRSQMRSRTSLLSLPNETLFHITQFLAPTLATMANPTLKSRYKGLSSLSLVCRQLLPICQDTMFRIIYLADRRRMVLLIRTLLEKRSLRDRVRYITIGFIMGSWYKGKPVSLGDKDVVMGKIRVPLEPAEEDLQLVIKFLRSHCAQVLCHPPVNVHREASIVSGGLLAILFYMTPKLERLGITSGPFAGTREHPGHIEVLATHTVLKKAKNELQSQVLSAMQRLQIIAPRFYFAGSTGALFLCSRFSDLSPRLETIEILGSQDWSVDPSWGPVQTGGIKEIITCGGPEKDILCIARSFPGAKKLTIIPEPHPGRINVGTIGASDLRSGILHLNDTLEYLHLVVPWNKFTLLKLQGQPGEPSLGCLRSLGKLKHLHIELGALCRLRPPNDYCLASNLPPSLEVLELVATWERDHSAYKRARPASVRISHLKTIWNRFSVESARLQPNLRFVRLLMRKVSKAFRHRIAPLKASWAARGVKFEVNCL